MPRSWYGVGSEPDLSFNSHSIAFALQGASHQDDDLYIMINGYWEEVMFHIQEDTASEWRRVVDTSLDSPVDVLEPGDEVLLQSMAYRVPARTVVVLVRESSRDPRAQGVTHDV